MNLPALGGQYGSHIRDPGQAVPSERQSLFAVPNAARPNDFPSRWLDIHRYQLKCTEANANDVRHHLLFRI